MGKIKSSEYLDGSEIAIIGMAGRFPGAQNIGEFWNNLSNGVESITFFSEEQLQASGVNPEMLKDPNYVKAMPVLKDIEMFDADFFGMNPREAAGMDPQHRLFLECVWEALESAGYDAETYKGAISVYAGAAISSYFLNNIYTNQESTTLMGEFQDLISNTQDSLATRAAYKMNLKGACYTVQTFCSTALVAVHMACQSLLNFECDMAVAGGVNIVVPQNRGYLYQESGIVSPDGHCRPFDANAKGTIFGNGLGVVVLKRLEDALADRDHIDALVKGTATNNDGSLKVSYTAPSVVGQAEVITEALANADVEPETIQYIEAHGTGTSLGDPTEITALTRAFRSGTQKNGFCAIGSVKANIGHLDIAAGVVGLIKTVLAMKHRKIPPTLHFKEPNPDIDFINTPFYVNAKLSEWESNGIPRRAGVSSFGIGGTNAHVILQEAPDTEKSGPSRPWQLLLLSAKTSTALDTAAQNLASQLKQFPKQDIADIAYTLQVGRKAFNHRRMVVCQNAGDAIAAFDINDPKRILTACQEKRNPPVAFMFSGQGAQYVNMGLELYATESVFREEIDSCSEILKAHISLDLRELLYPEEEDIEAATHKLKQTYITQPALFAIEYALAKLWMQWGVHPEAMVGHSIGEYVAACLAGVFTKEDALALVAARGRLMQELPGGAMLAVPLSQKAVLKYLNEDLSLAAINGPSLCVVSGEKDAIENLEEELSGNDINCRNLHTSHAFHSKVMDTILDSFAEQVGQIRCNPPQIPFVSNVTGTWIDSNDAMSPEYWARHIRQTVLFSDCVGVLLKEQNRILLEVGPGNTLHTLARQHPIKAEEHIVLSSIRHPKEERSDEEFIVNTLGQLWLAGVQIDWAEYYADECRHRVPLSTYPFERKRYWINPGIRTYAAASTTAAVAEKTEETELSSQVQIEQKDDKSYKDAPRSPIEQSIAGMWQELLGVERIGIHDNFFDLGGNSLIAVSLFAQIEKKYGKKLPLATLFNAPTVEQLAGILKPEVDLSTWSSLVKIQPAGSKPPFFCMHGAGGNVLNYRDLSHHLGKDQPFYGLQAQGLDGIQPILNRIEDMAALYIREIKKIQPEGPYLLGGYCLGGTLSLEMAQQLQSQGEKVALLALLDTYNWAEVPDKSLYDNVHFYAQKIYFHFRNFIPLESKDKMAFLGEKMREVKRRSKVWSGSIKSMVTRKGNQDEQNSLLARMWEINDRAADEYVPKYYRGRVTVFLPFKRYSIFDKPEAMWKSQADEVKIHELPVYPAGMLVEPFVQILAEKLTEAIGEALKSHPTK